MMARTGEENCQPVDTTQESEKTKAGPFKEAAQRAEGQSCRVRFRSAGWLAVKSPRCRGRALHLRRGWR